MRAALGVLVDLLAAVRAIDRRLVVLPLVLVIPLVFFRVAATCGVPFTACS
jgi:hypothetical protein